MANSELVLGSTEGRPIRLELVKLITADGVKTYTQLLSSIYTDVLTIVQADEIPVIIFGNLILKYSHAHLSDLSSIEFLENYIASNQFYAYQFSLKASGSTYLVYDTYHDNVSDSSADIVPNGTTINICKYVVG